MSLSRSHIASISSVLLLAVGSLALGWAAPATAQEPPIVVLPPGAVAGDQVVVSISGTGCDQQVDIYLAWDGATAGEIASDAVPGGNLLTSVQGAPDGTWNAAVPLQLWGTMTISYSCAALSGSFTTVTPPVDPPLAMAVTPLAATVPGTVRFRVSGSGCPGPVARVGALPSPPPPNIGFFAVPVLGSAVVEPDGAWSAEVTSQAWPQLGAGPTPYSVQAACYQSDVATYVPVLRYAAQLQPLTPLQATTTTVPGPSAVTPAFTG